MRSKKYGLEIYGQPNRNAWVSRDASGGNDGAHVSGAEIKNGNQLKMLENTKDDYGKIFEKYVMSFLVENKKYHRNSKKR